MSRVLHWFYVTMSEPKPPTVNHLYRNGYRGQRVLTKEGEAFKAALTRVVVEECMTLPWKAAFDAVYLEGAGVRLTIGIHASIFNAAWRPGGLTAKGNLQCPYKKMDASNYVKAIEDAVVQGTGIDDSCHIESTIKKLNDDTPSVEVSYEILSRY